MSKFGYKLIQFDYDNMDEEYTSKEVAIFSEPENGNGKPAYGKACEFMEKMEPFKPYLGGCQEVFPKFKLERITIY